MVDVLECPKCAKKTLIKRRDDLFQCINCDFKRDLTEAKPTSKPEGEFAWILLLGLLIAAILKGLAPDIMPPSNPQPAVQQPSVQPQGVAGNYSLD